MGVASLSHLEDTLQKKVPCDQWWLLSTGGGASLMRGESYTYPGCTPTYLEDG